MTRSRQSFGHDTPLSRRTSNLRSPSPATRIAGVVLNRVGSERHRKLASDAIAALGVPVVGAERVNRALTDTAELLESLHDQTVALMNQGARLDEVIHSVHAPRHLLERPFWAFVLSHIFSLPLLGAELAQPTGGSTAALGATGLSETFTNRLRDEVVPGTSALFALLSAGDLPLLRMSLEERRSIALVTEVTTVRETPFLELFST